LGWVGLTRQISMAMMALAWYSDKFRHSAASQSQRIFRSKILPLWEWTPSQGVVRSTQS